MQGLQLRATWLTTRHNEETMENPLFVASSACHTFQEVCAKGTCGIRALCDAAAAAIADAFRSETMHNVAHRKLA